MSQTLKVESAEPETMRCPFAFIATPYTVSSCPFSVCSTRPVFKSQTFTVASSEADAAQQHRRLRPHFGHCPRDSLKQKAKGPLPRSRRLVSNLHKRRPHADHPHSLQRHILDQRVLPGSVDFARFPDPTPSVFCHEKLRLS